MSIKTQQPEGNGASQLVQLMKIHGHNKDVDIELATVTAAPPALRIKIDNMPIELEADDLIVAERLTTRKEKITITAPTVTATAVGGGNIPVQLLTLTEAEIEYGDELSIGDRVIVAEVNEGQTYIILDRAVIY
jgi:Protein of unknown function (DUF2577)